MRSLAWIVSLPFRLAGAILVVAGFASGFFDLYRSVETGHTVLTPLGAIWYRLSPETLNLAQAGIQRGLAPAIWDPGVQFFLSLPGFLAFLILATLFLLVAQLIYRPR
jgi:hypothetical protein